MNTSNKEGCDVIVSSHVGCAAGAPAKWGVTGADGYIQGYGLHASGVGSVFVTGKDNNTTEQYNVKKQSVWKRLVYS